MALLRAVALASSFLLVAVSAARAASEGDPAPEVELAPLGGEAVDLAALHGRVVFLDFWATWCSPCVEQLRVLDRIARKTGPDGPAIVAVSIDADGDTALRFLAEKFPGAAFRTAHDPGSEALSSFGAEAIPALYVIDPSGVVRETHFGPGGADEVEQSLEAFSAVAPSASPSGAVD